MPHSKSYAHQVVLYVKLYTMSFGKSNVSYVHSRNENMFVIKNTEQIIKDESNHRYDLSGSALP
jgi:hypothetical protein